MAVIEEDLGGQHTHPCTPHVRVSIPECCVKHANDNKGQGIRSNSGKSEGGNLELTSCTHTQEEKELVPVTSHATLMKHANDNKGQGMRAKLWKE